MMECTAADRAAIARYLGMPSAQADGTTRQMIENGLKELEKTAEPHFVMRRAGVEHPAADSVEIDGCRFFGREPARSLKGCVYALLFAATLGAETDRLLHIRQAISIGAAAVLDACASVVLEEFVARRLEHSGAEMERHGLYLRWFTAPGYTGFDLRYQEQLLRLVDAPKRIAVTLTGGGLLVPTKSMTGIAGICTEKTAMTHKCRGCDSQSCPYRSVQFTR